MSGRTLILKNLLRNQLRTLLTVVAIALPMFVFVITQSFRQGFNDFLKQSDQNLRVTTHQKITFTTFLPQRIRSELEAMAPEGYIQAICRTSWFGGRVEGKQVNFPNMAVDRDTFAIVWDEFNLTPEQVERFQSERRGAVISEQLAKMMDWRVGDRVTLKGSIPPFLDLEFIIVAISPDIDGPWMYFGLDYYDEAFQTALGRPVGVHNFWMKLTSPQARQWALTEIDKRYANSEFETRTETESTFLSAFVKSGGDWIGMVSNVGMVIVLVAVAVAFNTMSMAFRERARELAVLRALGFQASRIARMVMTEGFLLGLMGGLIAVGPIFAATTLSHVEIPGIPMAVEIAPTTAALAMGVAIGCGLLAATVPAVMATRLRVAPALRKVA